MERGRWRPREGGVGGDGAGRGGGGAGGSDEPRAQVRGGGVAGEEKVVTCEG
jgi:hypothetical protein